MSKFKPIPESGQPVSCIGTEECCSAVGLIGLTLLATAAFGVTRATKKRK